MPVESAADRAVFFNTDEHGLSGSWTLAAGGAPSAVPLILDRPDELIGFGAEVGVVLPEMTARCAIVDLPAGYGKGDSLVVGADTFTVERVDLDQTRTIGTAVLRAIV